MKKIFTLIFSMGLLTAAFAQDGHRHRDNNVDNGTINQSFAYQNDYRDRGNEKFHETTPYLNSRIWDSQSNRDDFKRRDDYRSNDRGDWSYEDRHDDNGFHRDVRYNNSRKHRMHRTGLQISFGFGR